MSFLKLMRMGLAIANPTKSAYCVLRWVAKKRQPNLRCLMAVTQRVGTVKR